MSNSSVNSKIGTGLRSLEEYFRHEYRIQEKSWVCPLTKETYTPAQISKAVVCLRGTDPGLYRILEFLWSCPGQSRNFIASTRAMDASTLNRSWHKALNTIRIYLAYPDLALELKPIRIDFSVFTL